LLPDAKKEFTLAPENGTQPGPLSIQPAAAAPAAAPARPAAAVPAPAAVNPPLPQP
jgi:hypothetical protein